MNTSSTRKLMIALVCLAALQLNTAFAERVEEKADWTERFEISTDEPVLEIWNIWGNVTVLPGPDGEISLTIHENRSAPSVGLFDRSLDVYGLAIMADEDSVVVRVGQRGQSWHGSDPCRRCRAEYQFVARVPSNTRVYASTVNDGFVEISDIDGLVSADNVNGPVEINNLSACESVESVNGRVTLTFASAPDSDCYIETINGDISIEVPDGAGMDVAADLYNGRMVSEIPVDPVAMPARVKHRESGESHRYTIEQSAGVRLAGGGPIFNVSSINGDLRIQKSK